MKKKTFGVSLGSFYFVTPAEILAQNVQNLRKFHGLSMEEVAELAGVSGKTYGNIENGRANPTLNTIQGLAEAFQVEIFELLIQNQQFNGNQYVYEVFRENCFDRWIGHYTSYGLLLKEQSTLEEMILDEIHDITTDKRILTAFCYKLNKYQLYPVHFGDAVEDFLAAISTPEDFIDEEDI